MLTFNNGSFYYRPHLDISMCNLHVLSVWWVPCKCNFITWIPWGWWIECPYTKKIKPAILTNNSTSIHCVFHGRNINVNSTTQVCKKYIHCSYIICWFITYRVDMKSIRGSFYLILYSYLDKFLFK